MNKIFFIIFLFIGTVSKAQIMVQDVIDKIKTEVNIPWADKTVDLVKAGNPETELKGIATTFMATMEVLKKANAKGLNLVITHEPTFYSHTDDLSLRPNDAIQKAKIKYIEDNDMVVWRFHDHSHGNNPDLIWEGMIDRFGWREYRNEGSMTFTIPEMTLAEIVKDIEEKFGAKTMRIVGNPDDKFSKIGMALGASGSFGHFRTLKNQNTELLIVGESNEWETVPYVQDAIELGYNKALIVMGHADSEETGMLSVANWLKDIFPKEKIEFIASKNPYWRSKRN